MTDLLWPGDHRAGDLMSAAALLDAMLAVEAAWSAALIDRGIAPEASRVDQRLLAGLLDENDHQTVAVGAEDAGNPVVPLVRLLRDRLGAEEAPSRWLHRGLTSQDVLDTALMTCARDAVGVIRAEVRVQIGLLCGLVERYRRTEMVARTLGQHAVPTTFGLKAGHWLNGVLDVLEDLERATFPVQFGGAAGTLAATVELAESLPSPVEAATGAAEVAADLLGLAPSLPWHGVRTPVTRIGDLAVRCTDAWGHVANDVIALSRPEIAEVREGVGGGSSTMPHKSNPVLSVLVRRAAIAAPPLASTLHIAAADSTDERSAGAWHVEWATLRTLTRRTVVAGSQTTDLLRALHIDEERMATTLSAASGVRSEQQTMAALTGHEPAATYVGASDAFIDAALVRARAALSEADR
ncbi:3-carboxy-cis,cis-muconate cycloisomerase [Nocardioides immobilis]|uniref:3-carboxy-cis,cis-muconate cycloisomerase n=1 Tax=Nocardioides immobilis TaxID=2049295 RepID=A0A417XUU5_9ACTN|nr:3-carboxy-cis,cis-muconate cycloisomerase [Nocardioides immobilis]